MLSSVTCGPSSSVPYFEPLLYEFLQPDPLKGCMEPLKAFLGKTGCGCTRCLCGEVDRSHATLSHSKAQGTRRTLAGLLPCSGLRCRCTRTAAWRRAGAVAVFLVGKTEPSAGPHCLKGKETAQGDQRPEPRGARLPVRPVGGTPRVWHSKPRPPGGTSLSQVIGVTV